MPEYFCPNCERVFAVKESKTGDSQGATRNGVARCPECRRARKSMREGSGGGGGRERQDFEVVCADCGKVTTVPFEPRGDRPVYCRECFQAHKPRNY